jgi:uncharacterized protein YbjT (DUF2867 family)
MQNLLASAPTIAGEGRMYSCMGSGKVPFIDARDVASAAVACLMNSGHEGKAYVLTGGENLSMSEVAARLSACLRREIEYVDVPAEAWIAAASGAGLPEWLARDLAAMNTMFARGLVTPLSPHFRELTGREPLSLEEFASAYAGAFGVAPQHA